MADGSGYPHALLVEFGENNVPRLKNKLVKYFQSKRLAGGGDCTVEHESGSRTAVLRFRVQQDQKNVLQKESHVLSLDQKSSGSRFGSCQTHSTINYYCSSDYSYFCSPNNCYYYCSSNSYYYCLTNTNTTTAQPESPADKSDRKTSMKRGAERSRSPLQRGDKERRDEDRGDEDKGGKEGKDKDRGDEERGNQDRGDKDSGALYGPSSFSSSHSTKTGTYHTILTLLL
ncbi:hypothetical protein WMY93_002211 [Mugilogobius chulae]|uniref:PAR14-like first RRM domain-containing protein n=1 Tax=Mugilogobius chulae TaxID=88201 RepID=A0AAW0Q1F9_9GOBI